MTSKARAKHKEPAAKKIMVEVECAFCQHSFGILSSFSNCSVCGGKGLISVAQHTEACPGCHDKGPDGFRFYCLHCQRTSVIPVKEPAVSKGA